MVFSLFPLTAVARESNAVEPSGFPRKETGDIRESVADSEYGEYVYGSEAGYESYASKDGDDKEQIESEEEDEENSESEESEVDEPMEFQRE
jgi:hypothetical protein